MKLGEIASKLGVETEMIERIERGAQSTKDRARGELIERLNLLVIEEEDRRVLAVWFDAYRRSANWEEVTSDSNTELARRLGLWP